MKQWTLLMAMVCLARLVVEAQTSTDDHCSVCKNHVHITENPYRLDFKRELPFILASGSILGAGFLVSALDDTKPFTEEQLANLNIGSINSFDRRSVFNQSSSAASASDYIRTGITIFPLLLLTEHHTKQDISALLVMSTEVMAITYGLTSITKNVANRTRPNAFNPAIPLDERTSSGARESFFSGHTSHTAAASFFLAKVISDYHPNMAKGKKIALWTLGAGIPATTAYLRVKAGKHFPTDVMAGYAVGAFTGWLVPHLHKAKKSNPFSKLNWQVYPTAGGMQVSLRMGL